MYDYNLIKDLRFPKVHAEDIVFNFCAHALAKKFVINYHARYFYRQRPESLMKVGHKKPMEWRDNFKYAFLFLKEHNLLSLGVPSFLLRPPVEYMSKSDADFEKAKTFVRELKIPQEVIQNDRILRACLSSNSAQEFIDKTATFKERFKQYFRVKISKKQTYIKLFGKVLYEGRKL